MLTVAETEIFAIDAQRIWSEQERGEFINWIAANPQAGNVIPNSGGCRKVRWSRKGMGKRGGTRIIYFNQFEKGVIWLLVIYTKSVRGNIPAPILKQIRESIENE